MPKVSVIVPVYGVEKYIERCARSLFEQTLDDIEYLFIDDCTPDRSIEILKNVLEEYPNRKSQVIIHRMDQNSGQAAVRKWGMLNASGAYVIHCDSDDWVDVDMYRAMYEKAVEEDADVVICDMAETDENNPYKSYVCCFNTNRDIFLHHSMSHIVTPSLCNKLFRRSIFMQNDIFWPQYAMAEDLTTTSQLLWFCDKIGYVHKPLYNYYVNTQSISRKIDVESQLKRFYESCANVENIEKFYEDKNPSRRVKGALMSTKLKQRNRLLYLVSHWKYYKLWLKTFSEMNLSLIFASYVPIKEKLRFIVTLMGLYPIYAKIKGLDSF